jgi:GT2 family glycosyltransferase
MVSEAVPLSVVIPTYRRERVLIDTLAAVHALLRAGDEIVVVDQTAEHEPATEAALLDLAGTGRVHWFRRTEPGICRAMNCGAWLARSELLLFLDDDIVPSPGLLEVHREALCRSDAPPATCGQVLQPWDAGPVDTVRDLAEGFHAAYSRECDILGLMGGNFGIRRQTFLDVGGLDENFFGVAYRWEAELSYRIMHRTGRKVRFLPQASLRHLHASAGGTRSHGTKDTWRHLSGSVGDYYFAMKSLPLASALRHSLTRLVRAPLNRATVRRPWIIPSLFVREVVACSWALGILPRREHNYLKPASSYELVHVQVESATAALSEARP